jgi:non-ribosomal peptide synthetase component F
MFANVVGLRAKLADDTGLGELLRHLDGRRCAALSYSDYPVEKLAKRMGIPRDPARNVIFDAVFAYQDLEFYEFAKGGLEISVELCNPGTTRYDCNLQVYRRPDRLVFELEYATDLFAHDSAENLLDACLRALAELVGDPGTPVFSTPFRDSLAAEETLRTNVNSVRRSPVR